MNRRTPEQKTLDFMLAYGTGPQKLTKFTTPDLTALAARWRHLQAQAVEATLQARIDEEGCSAVFASLKDYLWSTYGAKSPVTQTVTDRSLKVTVRYPNRLITDGIS